MNSECLCTSDIVCNKCLKEYHKFEKDELFSPFSFEDETLKCIKCNKSKHPNLFSTKKVCKDCIGLDNKFKTIINFRKYLFDCAKARAKKKNIIFNLKEEDIHIPDECPVLGIKFNFFGTRKSHPYSPSIDRIIPERGYVSDNIKVISSRANTIKNDATINEIKAILSYMERELPLS